MQLYSCLFSDNWTRTFCVGAIGSQNKEDFMKSAVKAQLDAMGFSSVNITRRACADIKEYNVKVQWAVPEKANKRRKEGQAHEASSLHASGAREDFLAQKKLEQLGCLCLAPAG